MSGLHSRNKGKRGEREVVQLLQPIVDSVYARQRLEAPVLQRNTLQSDGGGYDIVGLEWLALEVKFHDKPNVRAWWQQTCAQATRGRYPLLLWRRTGLRSWNAQMWAMLDGVKVPVSLHEDDFVVWFSKRLEMEVRGQQPPEQGLRFP